MIYVDTSVVVALLTVEPMTPAVKRWYAELAELPMTADWCVTEFASAIALKTRTGQLTVAQAKAVTSLFDALAAGGLCFVPVSRIAFREAAALVQAYQHGLRAGDSLHLAMAREMGATSIATLDQDLAVNAVRLGLTVEPINTV